MNNITNASSSYLEVEELGAYIAKHNLTDEILASSADLSEFECTICSGEYSQDITSVLVRYHSSSSATSKIIETKFCPNCGRRLSSPQKTSNMSTRTLCCSTTCEKRFECGRSDINNVGMYCVEDYSRFGSGTFTDEGCTVEHWCGKQGNYKMFEPAYTKAVLD